MEVIVPAEPAAPNTTPSMMLAMSAIRFSEVIRVVRTIIVVVTF